MPIVAGISGNTGNRTITMIVRALALQHIQTVTSPSCCGASWGGPDQQPGVGRHHGHRHLPALSDAALGAVMTLADPQPAGGSLMGVIIPATMSRLGRDPAVGANVITAITDTGGFFIFLGLATLFLL